MPAVGKLEAITIDCAHLEEARARVEALGGRRVSGETFEEFGYRWIVMADPEGNELCLVVPPPGAPDA